MKDDYRGLKNSGVSLILIPLDTNLFVPELYVHLQEDLCFKVCVSITVTTQRIRNHIA